MVGEILVRGVVSAGGGGGGGGFGGVRDAVTSGHRAGVGIVFSLKGGAHGRTSEDVCENEQGIGHGFVRGVGGGGAWRGAATQCVGRQPPPSHPRSQG